MANLEDNRYITIRPYAYTRKALDGKRSKQAKRSQKEKTGGRLMRMFTMTPDEVLAKLENLLADPEMITLDAYSPDAENYPTGRISFVEQHLRYLRTHKNVDPVHYISNLELMIKKR